MQKFIAKPVVVQPYEIDAVAASEDGVTLLLVDGQQVVVPHPTEDDAKEYLLLKDQHGRYSLIQKSHFEVNYKDAAHSGHSTGA